MGTWERVLDQSKTKGQTTTSETIVNVAIDGGVKQSGTMTKTDGSTITWSLTGLYDGREHPFTFASPRAAVARRLTTQRGSSRMTRTTSSGRGLAKSKE